jgi:predicted amidohydrolase
MNDGPWKGWRGIGCSLVIDPNGQEALFGPYGAEADTILYVDIAPQKRPAQGTDWPSVWQKK